MTTPRLLWGMTWLGGEWGIKYGAMSGCISWMIVLTLYLCLLVYDSITRPSSMAYESTFAQLICSFAIVWFSVLFVIVFALTIAFASLLDGMVIGIVTRLCFYPTANWENYRRMAKIVNALVSIPIGFFGPALIFIKLNGGSFSMTDLGRMLIFLPIVLCLVVSAAITFVTAGRVAQRLALWYEKETTEGTAVDVLFS